MPLNTVSKILISKYPEELVHELLKTYKDVKENFKLARFKPSELEGGFFVEIVRRIIDFELFRAFIPIGKQLSAFNDNEIKKYENASGDESYRLHIPKALRTIYNLRNKRGVGHLSLISPNLMDSTFIVATCDWVLAELVRLNSNIPVDQCQRLIEILIQTKIPLIFDNGSVQRVLDISLSIKDQVIHLLYHNAGKVSLDDLLRFTEYKNASRFKREILLSMHKSRYVEFDGKNVELTPIGISYLEQKIALG